MTDNVVDDINTHIIVPNTDQPVQPNPNADLIAALNNFKNPPAPTGPSTLGTIGIGVLIFVLLVGGVLAIYLITSQPLIDPYPLSTFKYGDKITIRPAILTDMNNGTPNQYLRTSTNPLYNSTGVGPGRPMGFGAGALQFTGRATDPESQWELVRLSASYTTSTPYDADQSLVYGLGNRFYLRNVANPNPVDPAARMKYQLQNQITRGFCTSLAPVVAGAASPDNSAFNSELLIYFMPTNFPDYYWLLFPTCSTDARNTSPNTTYMPNDGILSIRSWADLNPQGTQEHDNANLCADYVCSTEVAGIFNPFTDSTNTTLNNNILLTNYLPITNRLPPYNDPQVKLFEVKLA